MATKLMQVVGYVEPAIKQRMARLSDKHRFLTKSIIVSMAVVSYLPELEREVAKGRLPQPICPR